LAHDGGEVFWIVLESGEQRRLWRVLNGVTPHGLIVGVALARDMP
jgi:hypothetical protein